MHQHRAYSLVHWHRACINVCMCTIAWPWVFQLPWMTTVTGFHIVYLGCEYQLIHTRAEAAIMTRLPPAMAEFTSMLLSHSVIYSIHPYTSRYTR